PDFIAIQILAESLFIQTERASISGENRTDLRRVAPGVLIFVKQIVHLPEAPLKAGRFGSERRFHGVCMHRQRIFPKDHTQGMPVLTLESADDTRNNGA